MLERVEDHYLTGDMFSYEIRNWAFLKIVSKIKNPESQAAQASPWFTPAGTGRRTHPCSGLGSAPLAQQARLSFSGSLACRGDGRGASSPSSVILSFTYFAHFMSLTGWFL